MKQPHCQWNLPRVEPSIDSGTFFFNAKDFPVQLFNEQHCISRSQNGAWQLFLQYCAVLRARTLCIRCVTLSVSNVRAKDRL